MNHNDRQIKVRYYTPITGGCFLCLYDKPGEPNCKYGCKKKERRIAVDRLAALRKK